MAAPSLNATAILASIGGRLKGYTFNPGQRRVNGAGGVIVVGRQSVTWRWASWTQAEWDWWTSTLMGGADNLALTAAELWDEDWNEQSFTGGYCYKPTHEYYRAGRFWNVEVTISNLTPLV